MFDDPYAPYDSPFNRQQYRQQRPQAPQPQQYQQPVDDRIFVPSPAAAEAYLVAPGCFVRLWDSQLPQFYERMADINGRPYPMQTYRYERVDNSPQVPQMPDFDRRFNALEQRIAALEHQPQEVTGNV